MNLSKPLMLGLGALVVGRMLTHGGATAQASAPQAGAGGGSTDGGLAGGLGGLLAKLQNAGHGAAVSSWVGPGQNQPIDPGQLHSALGQNTVSAVAQQAGMNEQDFMSQLAQKLPQFVDQLTPNGKMPSLQDVAAALTGKQA